MKRSTEENQMSYLLEQYEQIQDKMQGIIVRFIISAGFMVFLLWGSFEKGLPNFDDVITYLCFFAVIYSICFFIGYSIKLTQNYLVGIGLFIVFAYLFIFKLQDKIKIIDQESFIKGKIYEIIYVVIFLLPVGIDIFRVVKSLNLKKKINTLCK